MTAPFLRLFLVLLALYLPSWAFVTPILHHTSRKYRLLLSLSSQNDDNDSLNQMRKLLEASWNKETMGPVPTNVDDAASSAVTSIQNAQQDDSSSNSSQLPVFVDLLLPQYDIRQGTNLYDEVLAVEFCIKLASLLEGKSTIVVREDKTIQTVTRILDAREEQERQKEAALVDEEDDDDEEDEEEDDEEDDYDDSYTGDTQFYDDFADFGPIGDAGTSSVDVDSFRQQLISGWEKTSTTDELDKEDNKKNLQPPSTKRYRLASMLGEGKISKGADMQSDVIRSVAKIKPTEDEETILILSACSPEEMIGVRSLVAKYGASKRIVLVNCNLEPLPRELIRAQTVYSIQPLIARPKVSEGNLFGNKPPQDDAPPPPKVVVMRRFPRDWEIFVDVGQGFELAATIPSNKVDKRGPPPDLIAGCVKHHLNSRLT